MSWKFYSFLILVGAAIVEGKGKSSEDRIIGGEEVKKGEELPFMTIFNFKPSSTAKCTASLVTDTWLISAAHCLVSKHHFESKPCLKEMPGLELDAECQTTKRGDILVNFPKQVKGRTSEVLLGVLDLNDEREDVDHVLVRTIVINKDGYQGGMYGEYGGYDIILIKMSRSVKREHYLPACVPGPNYMFGRKLFIGGYGRYRRVPCETTSAGPQVYEYCKLDPACTKGSEEYQAAKCDVQFSFQGKLHKQCIRDVTPTSSDEECNRFKKVKKINSFRDELKRKNLDEIVILDSRGKLKTACYTEDAGMFGWCGTTSKIITGEKKDNKQFTLDGRPSDYGAEDDIQISSYAGWGVCGKTCDESLETEALTGTARFKPVEIMNQNWCDERLKKLRYGLEKPGQEFGFWVFPQVYCVAYNETYKTMFYKQQGSSYVKIPASAELHQNVMGRENSYYHRATGSCKGDSGGPLYEMKNAGGQLKYIVLGTTSRGTGPIGNCGGRGNPTHYVRVQDMVPWMKTHIKDLELC